MRKLAEKAGCKKWYVKHYRTEDNSLIYSDTNSIAKTFNSDLLNWDGDFIATFNPQTILAMLDVINESENIIGWFRDAYDPATERFNKIDLAFEKLEKL